MNLRVLGTISRSHGLKGAFKAHLNSASVSKLEKDEPVFIQLQGGPVPFFVEECSVLSHDKLLIKLEGIDSIDQIEKFMGKEILIESERFEGPKKDADEQIIGYEVFDLHKGELGRVSGIMQTVQHPILEIDNPKGTILVPWVAAIVKEVDSEKQVIEIDAPDGLIDLYISG